jgi:hypothetical protein
MMKPDPKKQSQFDIFMLQTRKSLYSDSGVEAFLSKIEQGDPAKAVAHTAAMLTKSVKGGLEEKGKTVTPDILAAAFKRTLNDLMEIAVAAKAVPEDQAKEVAKSAIAQSEQFLKDKPQAQAQQPAPEPSPAQPPAQPPAPAMSGLAEQAMGAL